MARLAAQFPGLSTGSKAALVHLLVHGPASRAELARQLGVSAASLTRISRTLVEGDLVRESDTPEPQRLGRPSQAMEVNVDRAHLLGFKLSAQQIDVVRTDLRATILHQRTLPLTGTSPEVVVDAIVDAVNDEIAVDPLVSSIGVSLAGPVSPRTEVIPISPFLGWRDVPLVQMLRDRTGLPAVVENDVRALTAAEHWFGAAAGCTDFALVTIGAGVGCGIVVDDRLIDGEAGGGGQIGHLPVSDYGPICERGHRGCVRSYLSSGAMVGSAAMALGRPDLSYAELLDLARGHNLVAERVLQDAAHALGTVIGVIAAMTAPQKVLISGEGVAMVPLVIDQVRSRAGSIQHWTVPEVPIELAPFTFTEWARGAAVMALRAQLDAAVRAE